MSYALGVDGVGLVMILLTAGLMPVLLLAAWNELDEGEGAGTVRRAAARSASTWR